MKRRRHTPEQVVRKLREAGRLLAEGKTVPEVAKGLEVSENTFHRWRAQYGGMKADDVKRLKELERENQQLKRIVANKELEIDALKEIARGRMKVKRGVGRPFVAVALGASRRRCVRRRSGLGACSGARVRGGARG
jgi:putative transposase